ncbi:MAG: aldo/keto reductase, partial [Ignavibacteriales bacterium]|nr:aldo/keto reductase [Ignavibacteriales bacterium]
GLWRAREWNYTTEQFKILIIKSLELGITTFDHADIYGGYECEALFGNVLRENPSLRNKMQIVTKCGIKLISQKFPEHQLHCYDISKEHIIKSVENSLRNLSANYIDLLLIHRPDPLMNADDTAEAFYTLKKSGKVLHFGVSNFLPNQFDLLQSRLDFSLVTNQIEVSVLNTEHFDNGNIDFLQERKIPPMVWSPFAGGRMFWENSDQANRVRNVLNEIADKYQVGIDSIATAWLLVHPVNFIVVLGSGKIDRIKSALKGLEIKLTRVEWFKIWIASKGYDVS